MEDSMDGMNEPGSREYSGPYVSPQPKRRYGPLRSTREGCLKMNDTCKTVLGAGRQSLRFWGPSCKSCYWAKDAFEFQKSHAHKK